MYFHTNPILILDIASRIYRMFSCNVMMDFYIFLSLKGRKLVFCNRHTIRKECLTGVTSYLLTKRRLQHMHWSGRKPLSDQTLITGKLPFFQAEFRDKVAKQINRLYAPLTLISARRQQ